MSWRDNITVKISLFITIALATLTGWWSQGGFALQIALAIIGIYIWLPVFVVVTLLGLIGWHRHNWKPWLMTTWGILGVIASGLLVSFGVGELSHHWQHSRVITFVKRAQRELDAERAKTGHYPASLPPSLAADLPAWLNHPGSYHRVGDHFQFTYRDPAAFVFGDYTFDSSERQWELRD